MVNLYSGLDTVEFVKNEMIREELRQSLTRSVVENIVTRSTVLTEKEQKMLEMALLTIGKLLIKAKEKRNDDSSL